MDMAHLFDSDGYMVRQKVMKILGEEFHIYSDESMNSMIGYSKMAALKLKEDIRLYSDESKSSELLIIKQKGILDFTGGFTIVDGQTGESLGTLRRKGMKSILRDSWVLIDDGGNVIGTLGEESGGLALIRRFIPYLTIIFPQQFHLRVNGAKGAVKYTQKMNPFVHKMSVTGVKSSGVDPRIAAAAAILLIAIEGRQTQGG
ncbi:MAG: hypothetical protein CMA31_04570 [Euryarchaeota archaeon]|mgnify:FL=1|nr:hypothetical protein [Euryarchaeota archaeon]RPG71379.1 MAG: hypothetical protein CBD52_005460 [Euryarchaeota archaeon TMED192]RPG71928.1 MAG: hypothetical protein CBD52_003610 [Euryarchaeota archaeon TMED192]|tara:strand:+ start:5804 stop:6409 length:606 start_codon:yes stop_codon:yes gene_type:complete